MKRHLVTASLISLFALAVSVRAQSWPPALSIDFVDTVAGGGSPADGLGDGGLATDAALSFPIGITGVDGDGNLFIPDTFNNRVRRVDVLTGQITTVAGNGLSGFSGDGGLAINARVGSPAGVAVDVSGNLFINSGSRIRRVDAVTGIITTVAGGGSPADGLGDGGPATDAQLKNPDGVAVDSAGNIFIAEDERDTIRRVDAVTGIITTVAGNGTFGDGGDGGPATSASFRFPVAVTVDPAGNLFIVDQGNHRIRRVDAATNIITTVAGNGASGFSGDGGPATSASLSFPSGAALDSAGNIFIPEWGNSRIRRLDIGSGIITTVAGNGANTFSGDGGPATSASFDFLTGAALDGKGNLFITDSNNNRIRRMFLGAMDSDGPITSGVESNFNPVPLNTGVVISANVDDSTTGGSNVTSAEYTIDGGMGVMMNALDGDFDEANEDVTASIPGQSAGVYEICVNGTDSAGNTGAAECILLPVYDPNGGFVTGGGWVNSPASADLENGVTGKANFGFVSKYLPGRSTPDGNLEFRFKAGDINFNSTSMDWLVVTGEPRAIFRGEGLLNGESTCKFEVDAWDESLSGKDAFGLKLFACGPGADVNRYDLPATALGGGSVKIHQN